MVKTATFTAHIGGRGGSADFLDLSGYRARAIAATLTKLDAGSTGQVTALNMTLKPYNAANVFKHDDAPSAGYEFAAADLGTTTGHELITGASVTLSSALPGGNAGAARYASAYGMVSPTMSATDSASGKSPLKVAEQNAQSWTWEAWVFRSNNAVQHELYIETNLAVSSFIVIAMNANGTLTVNRTNGGGVWTSPVGSVVPLNQWTHVCIVYSAGSATNQLFINGVSAGAATASTRGGPYDYTSLRSVLNRTAAGQSYITECYVYGNVLFVADDALRHYNELATDLLNGNFVSSTANIGINGGASVIFTNDIAPAFYSAAAAVVMPLTPYCRIQTANGVFLAEVTTYRE